MICRYRYTFPDYKAAQRLYFRSTPRRRLLFFFWYRLMPVASTAALAVLLWKMEGPGRRDLPFWLAELLGAVAFIGFYVLASRPFQFRRAFRRIMEGNNVLERSIELELKGEELLSRIPGQSETRFQPTALYDIVRDNRICLIFLRKRLFLFIPRGDMPEDFWTALTAWSGKGRTL